MCGVLVFRPGTLPTAYKNALSGFPVACGVTQRKRTPSVPKVGVSVSFLRLRSEKRRFGFGSNLAVNGQAAAQLELFHGCGGLGSKQAVRIPGIKSEG